MNSPDDAFDVQPEPASWFSGFRVDSPGGRIGFVDELVRGTTGHAFYLLVRAGRAGRLLFLISADEIEAIFPARKQVLLRHHHSAGLHVAA